MIIFQINLKASPTTYHSCNDTKHSRFSGRLWVCLPEQITLSVCWSVASVWLCLTGHIGFSPWLDSLSNTLNTVYSPTWLKDLIRYFIFTKKKNDRRFYFFFSTTTTYKWKENYLTDIFIQHLLSQEKNATCVCHPKLFTSYFRMLNMVVLMCVIMLDSKELPIQWLWWFCFDILVYDFENYLNDTQLFRFKTYCNNWENSIVHCVVVQMFQFCSLLKIFPKDSKSFLKQKYLFKFKEKSIFLSLPTKCYFCRLPTW